MSVSDQNAGRLAPARQLLLSVLSGKLGDPGSNGGDVAGLRSIRTESPGLVSDADVALLGSPAGHLCGGRLEAESFGGGLEDRKSVPDRASHWGMLGDPSIGVESRVHSAHALGWSTHTAGTLSDGGAPAAAGSLLGQGAYDDHVRDSEVDAPSAALAGLHLQASEGLVGSWPSSAGGAQASDAALPFFPGSRVRTGGGTCSTLSSMGGAGSHCATSFSGAAPGSARASGAGAEAASSTGLGGEAVDTFCGFGASSSGGCSSAPITPRSPCLFGEEADAPMALPLVGGVSGRYGPSKLRMSSSDAGAHPHQHQLPADAFAASSSMQAPAAGDAGTVERAGLHFAMQQQMAAGQQFSGMLPPPGHPHTTAAMHHQSQAAAMQALMTAQTQQGQQDLTGSLCGGLLGAPGMMHHAPPLPHHGPHTHPGGADLSVAQAQAQAALMYYAQLGLLAHMSGGGSNPGGPGGLPAGGQGMLGLLGGGAHPPAPHPGSSMHGSGPVPPPPHGLPGSMGSYGVAGGAHHHPLHHQQYHPAALAAHAAAQQQHAAVLAAAQQVPWPAGFGGFAGAAGAAPAHMHAHSTGPSSGGGSGVDEAGLGGRGGPQQGSCRAGQERHDRRSTRPAGDGSRGGGSSGRAPPGGVRLDDTSGSSSLGACGPLAASGRSSADPLLEEFKANRTRRWEMRDVLGHVLEFSLDQLGSRFIQQRLDTLEGPELAAAWAELAPKALLLMNDVFGNYVVQRFLEIEAGNHRSAIAAMMRGQVLSLSLQLYSCRVVQKALEVLPLDGRVSIVAELEGSLMRCVRDQNGNHVVQKIIECVPSSQLGRLLTTFAGNLVPLSQHAYGCRVMQRILEHCGDAPAYAGLVAEILAATVTLAQDQYGNYVIQHVVERGSPEERCVVYTALSPHILVLSRNKFASNVVEKLLLHSGAQERHDMVEAFLSDAGAAAAAAAEDGSQACAGGGSGGALEAMMQDQYGNYVVQRALEVCDEVQRERLLSRVRNQHEVLKGSQFGKHIVNRLEKLLSAGMRIAVGPHVAPSSSLSVANLPQRQEQEQPPVEQQQEPAEQGKELCDEQQQQQPGVQQL